jgi:hypothetical protein
MTSRILPVLLILIAVGLLLGYVRPTYAGPVSVLSQRIASYDAALAAADAYDAREAELARQRDQLPQDELSRLESFLPDGVDNVRIILDLNALASRTGISLADFTVGESSAAPAPVDGAAPADTPAPLGGFQNGSLVDSVDLSVTATGTYHAFRSFLDGIESSLRPMDVVRLDVKGSATGVYTYSVTLRIYWLR